MVSIQNSPINHDANQLKLSKRTKYIYLDLETKYFIYLSLFLWVFWRNTTNGSSIQTLFLFLKFEFLPMDYVLLFPNMAADASLVEWITVRCECILNSL